MADDDQRPTITVHPQSYYSDTAPLGNVTLTEVPHDPFTRTLTEVPHNPFAPSNEDVLKAATNYAAGIMPEAPEPPPPEPIGYRDEFGGLAPSALAPTEAGAAMVRKNLVDPLVQRIATPGLLAWGIQPSGPGGMITEEDMFKLNSLEDAARRFGPEQAYAMTTGAMLGQGALGTAGTFGAGGGRGGGGYRTMTSVPDLRGVPVNDAIKIAREQPHLIPLEGGGFVGAPPSIKTKADLAKLRRAFDKYVAQNPQGGDWYDRYRAAVQEVTGNNPIDNLWMANQEAQWSAGVSPENELQFALRENNAALAGMPVKAARPAQHAAHLRAIEQQDPTQYQLGQKTGQYASQINPDQPPGAPFATGVNDFRYARQWGYPTVSGQTNTGGRGVGQGAAHRFMDYETALAVDRANKKGLGGRSDWTGEQLQANPWVEQKARDLMVQRNMPYEEAYQEALKTIGEWFPKHTAFETYEAQPGAGTRHLPGSETATQEERIAYAADPRSTWMDPETGRDILYGGLRIPNTGVAMRVRPSTTMQGVYTNPQGVTEFNPGEVARPLIAFQTGKPKTIAPADRALMEAAAATRGYVDVQNFAGAHKPFLNQQVGQSPSWWMPRDRPLTTQEAQDLQAIGSKYGLPHLSDTGQGVTITNWEKTPELLKGQKQKDFVDEITARFGQTGIERSAVDPIGVSYGEQFAGPQGTGAATREMLQRVSATPRIREIFNNHPDIGRMALNRLERDKEWAKRWGATREDVSNARKIIGQGPGWIDRLDAALKAGRIALPVATAVLGGSLYLDRQQPGR